MSEALAKQAKELKHRPNSEPARETVKKELKDRTEKLQLELVKIQTGLYQQKARAIIVFEGFDAAGKGGCIRKLTETVDPRGVTVHPIGPPTVQEQGTHWLYRFWKRLPPPGMVAVFDRSWYGRVLVERVEKLAPKPDWKRAYREIREFERMLTEDGVELIKFFLAVSPEEQLKRFRDRLEDPYKHWKLTMADIEARSKWKDYVEAADDLLEETSVPAAPWSVIGSDEKSRAHFEVVKDTVTRFSRHGEWLESRTQDRLGKKEIRKALKQLKDV